MRLGVARRHLESPDVYHLGLKDSTCGIHQVTGTLHFASIAFPELFISKVGARHASPLLSREINHSMISQFNKEAKHA